MRALIAQGRVTFTNVKPKHDGYDVMNVEYERQPFAPAAAPVTVALRMDAELRSWRGD